MNQYYFVIENGVDSIKITHFNLRIHERWSQDSSVGIVTRYGLHVPGI